ncbi:Proteasome subunit alpha type [Corchorus olitorius]|uniref:Proteasome subunit alpha type n=1 Tax=Corchorus olitorius TaxID=93759 RepID=A0A1R3IZZ4_9ROSI|nr:Proteasome subunit alpha type [Corchorus olitorius]
MAEIIENKAADPTQCVMRSKNAAWSFLKIKSDHSTTKRGHGLARSVPEEWTPPPPNFLKFNSDGSYDNGNAGLGVVVRNELGQTVDGFARYNLSLLCS